MLPHRLLQLPQKALLCFCLLGALSLTTRAQEKTQPSMQFTVMGEVRDSLTVTVADLKKMSAQKLDNLVITNHKGEVKRELQGLKGVPLKTILEKLTLTSPSPKELSEYYFVCKAKDGYTNVYSWNELFNTDIGNHVFVVTEYKGQTLGAMPEQIMLVATKDFRTGRRNLKNLVKIEVGLAR